jgi:hypothetical protein
MKLTVRELALLAVFGALWGVVEISLGTVLKSIHFPLSGIFLASIGLIIALIARIFVPRTGAILFVGIIAMLLKLFSLGGVIIGPMVGILAEALIAEIVVSLLGPSSLSFVLAGALGIAWSAVQPFVTGPLLFGRGLLDVWGGDGRSGQPNAGVQHPVCLADRGSFRPPSSVAWGRCWLAGMASGATIARPDATRLSVLAHE